MMIRSILVRKEEQETRRRRGKEWWKRWRLSEGRQGEREEKERVR